MTFLTGLTILNAAIVLVALVRVRPGVLLIALNQVMTLRALDNIQSYGQPTSEPFLPNTLFAQHNIDIAGNIFAISTLLLGVTVVWPHRSLAVKATEFPA